MRCSRGCLCHSAEHVSLVQRFSLHPHTDTLVRRGLCLYEAFNLSIKGYKEKWLYIFKLFVVKMKELRYRFKSELVYNRLRFFTVVIYYSILTGVFCKYLNYTSKALTKYCLLYSFPKSESKSLFMLSLTKYLISLY